MDMHWQTGCALCMLTPLPLLALELHVRQYNFKELCAELHVSFYEDAMLGPFLKHPAVIKFFQPPDGLT